MSDIERHINDDLITEYEALQERLRAAEFPRLVVEEIEDDGETYMGLRCPRCGGSISEAGELFAVSPAEHWGPNEDLGDYEFDHDVVVFDPGERPDLEATLYYKHGDSPGHAVSLPDGWEEDWT